MPTYIMEEQIHFLHAVALSSTKQSWLMAIKRGYFKTWPGLASQQVAKHLKLTKAMCKGYIQKQQQNARSTKKRESVREEKQDLQQEENNKEMHLVYMVIMEYENIGKIYSDQTGQFPVTASKDNKYVMVLYVYDPNAILLQSLKNRTDAEITRAYKTNVMELKKAGYNPNFHRLDNEAPPNLKEYNKEKGITYQFTPPHMHQVNAAERAICTFKEHFIASLCSINAKFLLHLWFQLIKQAEMILNISRPCRRSPAIAANTAIWGEFEYNRTPLALPGSKIITHKKTGQRGSWDPHRVDDWYIGPAMQHYRCFRVYCTWSRAERIGDTIDFSCKTCKCPTSVWKRLQLKQP
eukprot:13411749-Ditylum_brightwellii.AAC.1